MKATFPSTYCPLHFCVFEKEYFVYYGLNYILTCARIWGINITLKVLIDEVTDNGKSINYFR
jgi:hypothetical protein